MRKPNATRRVDYEPTENGDGDTLRQIAECLWPDGRLDHEWTPETLEAIAHILTREGFNPEDE